MDKTEVIVDPPGKIEDGDVPDPVSDQPMGRILTRADVLGGSGEPAPLRRAAAPGCCGQTSDRDPGGGTAHAGGYLSIRPAPHRTRRRDGLRLNAELAGRTGAIRRARRQHLRTDADPLTSHPLGRIGPSSGVLRAPRLCLGDCEASPRRFACATPASRAAAREPGRRDAMSASRATPDSDTGFSGFYWPGPFINGLEASLLNGAA